MTTTTELFWHDLDDAIARSKAMPVDCWGWSHGHRMMHDFLHSHRNMWQKIKPDAMRNADRLAMLTAALLVRHSKWDASRTLTHRNPLRGMPIRLDECRTDAEREAWQRGYELGCGDEWSDPDTTMELTQLPEHLHEVAQDGGWWTGAAMQRMPWTSQFLTAEQIAQWVASREEVGAAIDIETCELGRWGAYDADPYGVRDLPDEMRQVGTNRFVRSPSSNGWVSEDDLPTEKCKAMYERIHREAEAYARAHPENKRFQPYLKYTRAAIGGSAGSNFPK